MGASAPDGLAPPRGGGARAFFRCGARGGSPAAAPTHPARSLMALPPQQTPTPGGFTPDAIGGIMGHARVHPPPISSRNGGYQPHRAPRICMLLIAALAIIPILGGG